MIKFKTSGGVLKFKTTPLYYGSKVINKDIAFENLLIVKRILDSHFIPFQLAYGTLLGAVRENDFIDHDEDIDLIILSEYKQFFIDLLPSFINEGFVVARYDRRGLLSIIKEGEYIDFYFFKKSDDGLRECSGLLCLANHIENTSPFLFREVEFSAPKNFEDFLLYEYGLDWRIPVQWHDYQMSGINRCLLFIKEIIKDLLPDYLYFKLVSRSEKILKETYKDKLSEYRENKRLHCEN